MANADLNRDARLEPQPDEQLIVPCCYCKVPILTWWAPNGKGMLRGEYVLIADWVYHPKCWDAALNLNPPFNEQIND